MKTLLCVLSVVRLLLNSDYGELPGYEALYGRERFRGYTCRHMVSHVPSISPPKSCQQCGGGQLIPSVLFVRFRCQCQKYLYYPGNDAPNEIRCRRGRHKQRPFSEGN